MALDVGVGGSQEVQAPVQVGESLKIYQLLTRSVVFKPTQQHSTIIGKDAPTRGTQ